MGKMPGLKNYIDITEVSSQPSSRQRGSTVYEFNADDITLRMFAGRIYVMFCAP